MKTLKITRGDIYHLLITKNHLEIVYKEEGDKEWPEVSSNLFKDQQEIQNLHEKTGKFGEDSDLSNL